MPNVSHLLKVATDDPSLAVPRIPVGTWKGELKRIVAASKDRDGNDLVDKNGDAYNTVRLLCTVTEPTDDVDPALAKPFMKAGGPDEVGILSMMFFVRRKRDVARVTQVLDSLGVPRAGRSFEQISNEYKGGIPCFIEVEHNDSPDGDERDNITAIYPIA